MGESQKPGPNPNSDIRSYDKENQRVLQTCPYCGETRAVKLEKVQSSDTYTPYCNKNHARAHDREKMTVADAKDGV